MPRGLSLVGAAPGEELAVCEVAHVDARVTEPYAVIRERTRSDHRFPDLGQQLGWSLSWEHTTVLAEERCDGSSYQVAAISRDDAKQLAASLVVRYWTPEAA